MKHFENIAKSSWIFSKSSEVYLKTTQTLNDRVKLDAFGPEPLWKVRQQAWSFVTIPVITNFLWYGLTPVTSTIRRRFSASINPYHRKLRYDGNRYETSGLLPNFSQKFRTERIKFDAIFKRLRSFLRKPPNFSKIFRTISRSFQRVS